MSHTNCFWRRFVPKKGPTPLSQASNTAELWPKAALLSWRISRKTANWLLGHKARGSRPKARYPFSEGSGANLKSWPCSGNGQRRCDSPRVKARNPRSPPVLIPSGGLRNMVIAFTGTLSGVAATARGQHNQYRRTPRNPSECIQLEWRTSAPLPYWFWCKFY